MDSIYTPVVQWMPLRKAAEMYVGLPSLPGERPLSREHVAELGRKMKTGLILPDNIVFATIEVDGVRHKGNGQHTATAALELNGECPDCKVKVTHYHAKDAEDAAQLYMQFDPTWGSRSYPHLSKMYWSAVGLLDSYPKKLVELFACAIAFDRGGATEFGRRNFKGQAKITLPPEHLAELKALHEICSSRKDSGHLWREPVCCAIFQTMRVSMPTAKRFWTAVRDGANLDKADARKRLEVYLRSVAFAQGQGGTRSKDRKATFHEMYSKCIHSWNASRANRTTDLKVYREAPLPVPN